jgi:hypothetical protein
MIAFSGQHQFDENRRQYFLAGDVWVFLEEPYRGGKNVPVQDPARCFVPGVPFHESMQLIFMPSSSRFANPRLTRQLPPSPIETKKPMTSQSLLV